MDEDKEYGKVKTCLCVWEYVRVGAPNKNPMKQEATDIIHMSKKREEREKKETMVEEWSSSCSGSVSHFCSHSVRQRLKEYKVG